MDYEPYMSTDLETTGLPHEEGTQILQLAAVFEEFKGGCPKTFNVIIDPGKSITGNVFALALNKWILDEILKHRKGEETSIPVVKLDKAKEMWEKFVDECMASTGREKNDRGWYDGWNKISIGGKNVSGFDRPFLQKYGFSLKAFKHRAVDPGPMFFADFGKIPSLDEINEKMGQSEVSHNALDDAMDVCDAVRYHIGMPKICREDYDDIPF